MFGFSLVFCLGVGESKWCMCVSGYVLVNIRKVMVKIFLAYCLYAVLALRYTYRVSIFKVSYNKERVQVCIGIFPLSRHKLHTCM